MPYKRTGNPPGRPRKHVEPPKRDLDPGERQGVENTTTVQHGAEDEKPEERQSQAWMGPQPATLCEECHPDGWPDNVNALTCKHGIWTRQLDHSA